MILKEAVQGSDSSPAGAGGKQPVNGRDSAGSVFPGTVYLMCFTSGRAWELCCVTEGGKVLQGPSGSPAGGHGGEFCCCRIVAARAFELTDRGVQCSCWTPRQGGLSYCRQLCAESARVLLLGLSDDAREGSGFSWRHKTSLIHPPGETS